MEGQKASLYQLCKGIFSVGEVIYEVQDAFPQVIAQISQKPLA